MRRGSGVTGREWNEGREWSEGWGSEGAEVE